jgi:hypothetical protein
MDESAFGIDYVSLNDAVDDKVNVDPSNDKTNIKELLSKKNTIQDVFHIKEFISLLETLVNSKNIQTEINISLSDKTRSSFLQIIKTHPEFFSDFEKTFVLILDDNKIDLNDLPYLTVLISKLYKIINDTQKFKYSQKEKLEFCSNVIKFIVQVLVKEKKLNLGDLSEEKLIESIEGVIDSCIDLININKKMESSFCGWFSKFC